MKFFSKLSFKSFSIIILSFVVVAIGLGVALFYNDPKIKFILLANNEYKSFVSVLNNASDNELATLSEDSTLSLSGNISFEISADDAMFNNSYGSIINIVNSLGINYEYASDAKGVNTYLKLDSNLSNKDLIDIEQYQSGDKSYIYYNGISDKYIESDSIDYINRNSNQIEDLTYFTDKVKSSFFSHLKSSDFKAENNKSITINNESITATKIAFTISDKRMKEILKAILTDVRDDEKCISILKELNSGEDVKASINESINSIDKETLLTENLIIDMYVKDNIVRELDIFSGDVKTIQYLNYEDLGSPTKQLIIFNGEQKQLDAKLVEKSSSNVSLTLSFSDDATVFNTDVISTTNSSKENKTWSNDSSIATTLSVVGTKLCTLTLNIKTTAVIGESVKTVNSNNIVKESDLTEEERNDISNKLLEKIISALPAELMGMAAADTVEVY